MILHGNGSWHVYLRGRKLNEWMRDSEDDIIEGVCERRWWYCNDKKEYILEFKNEKWFE